jgi:hypothetical protein
MAFDGSSMADQSGGQQTPPPTQQQASPQAQVQLPPGYEDAKPVQQASSASGIQLPPGYEDAQPVGSQPGFLKSAGAGVLKGLSDIGGQVLSSLDIGNMLWHSTIPGQTVDSIRNAIPSFQAYETARSKGASITDALNAANETAKQHNALLQAVDQRVTEFKKNPTQESVRGLVDAVGALGTVYALGPKAPEVEGAGAGGAASEAPSVTEAPPTPREIAIDKAVEGSGLRRGINLNQIFDEAQPHPSTVQLHVNNGVLSAAQDAGNGIEGAYKIGQDGATTSIRDAVGQTARAVTNAAKADFKALDEASGGRWQRFDDQLKNIRSKMSEVAGIDDDAYENLENKQNEVETLQAQMIEDMKAGGKVDPAIADRAVAQYKKGMALQDLSNAIRATTKNVPNPDYGPALRGGIGPVTTDNPLRLGGRVPDPDVELPPKMIERTDPNALANRLIKLNDVPPNGGASRLEQALGKEGAQNLTSHMDDAQTISQQIKDWTPTTPRGKQMLRQLVTKNASGNTIDWNGVQKDFLNLHPDVADDAFGNEMNKAQEYIGKKALWQSVWERTKNIVLYGGGAGLAEELARRGLNAAKHAFISDDETTK